MIHSIIIRPSRVELVLKTFSADYGKLSEKKLLSKDFSFRFNREIIDTGAYYKSLYRILADLLQPYKKDIKQLQISLRSSFFQVRSIHCEANMQTDKDYINWEVDKTINDVSEHFKYGTLYEENIQMLHLFIIRKSVETYFDEIMKKIISYDVNFSVGYDFINESKENIFVPTNKEVDKPFDSDQSSIRMWNLPTEKIRSEIRFKRTLISTIILFVLLSAFYLTYFQSENMYKLYTNLIDIDSTDNISDKDIPAKVDNNVTTSVIQDSIASKEISSEEKFLDKLFEDEQKAEKIEVVKELPIVTTQSLNLHDALDSLISLEPDCLILENDIVLIQCSDSESLRKSINLASKYKFKIITKNKNSFEIQFNKIDVEYLPATVKDHKRICKDLKINTDKPYLIIDNQSKFNQLTDLLHKKDLIYHKLVVSNRGSKFFISVYFD